VCFVGIALGFAVKDGLRGGRTGVMRGAGGDLGDCGGVGKW